MSPVLAAVGRADVANYVITLVYVYVILIFIRVLMSCTPAFYALVVEALVDAGVAHGLAPDMAATMAVESMAGTAAVLRARDRDTRALRARVTSPGGMTARGLAALERDGVRAAFEDAVAAVVEGRR